MNNEGTNVFMKAYKYLKDLGFVTTAYLVKDKIESKKKKTAYQAFIENNEKDILETKDLPYRPLFSFVVPVYNVLTNQLKECIDSVLNQTYDNFELILVDDKSTWKNVPKVLAEYEKNSKVKVIYRDENGHISRSTNTGIEVAKGEYIVFMDCDDTVSPNAVYEFTLAVNEDKTIDFIYSDEDKLSDDGKVRSFPFFKPDWSPDTFMSLMYTSHLSAYRRSIVNEIGGLRVGFEGSQDYDFTMRFVEKTNRIKHIPKILYHWRQRPESTASTMEAKPYVREAVCKLKKEALKRRGLNGRVEYIPEIQQARIVYEPQGNPLVSIIIPSKDNFNIIERCIVSLVERTTYSNYEIIVVDNGSNEENRKKYETLCKNYNARYYYEKLNFNFSKMCNIGADNAKGEYLLFLNDDIEIIEGSWLGNMLGQACLEYSGAVGAKLLYPDTNLIQHSGVINLPVGPCHGFSRMDDTIVYSFCRNRLEYNYIAVTAACLCVNKSKFNEVNGFDEELAVAYNDVDLCFKLYEHGYYNSVRSDAVLYHYESISRGIDTEDPEKYKRLVKERELLYSKHNNLKNYDPFYNVNLAGDRIDYELDSKYVNGVNNIEKANVDITGFINENRVNVFFDQIVQGSVIEIIGWTYIVNMPFNNFNKKYVIFTDEKNKTLIFDTNTMLRTDVSHTFGNNKNLNLSGFICNIDTNKIYAGKYRLGVLVVNKLTRKKYARLNDNYVIIQKNAN